MTNTQRKVRIEDTTFKVIKGGRNRKKPVERALGALLLVAGTVVLLCERDATALIFMGMIAAPMIFSKNSVMIK